MLTVPPLLTALDAVGELVLVVFDDEPQAASANASPTARRPAIADLNF